MKSRYTDEQLIEAVRSSLSLRQVLTKLGVVEAGGNYSIVKRRIQALNLDTSHFRGQAWRKNNCNSVIKARSLHEILKKDSPFQSYKLKQRLLKENIHERKCRSCLITEWMGRDVPLELHHVNGDADDNRIENLCLLCPNCHALTESYRGKKLAKCRDETAPF